MNYDLLKKHKKLHFYLKCLKRSSDIKFVTHVINYGYDASVFHLQQLGEKNTDKLIYFIGTVAKNCGFFDQHIQLLELLMVAERLQAVPMVYYGEDYLYYDREYSEINKNAFEYYFKPVSQISYEELKESYNVIKANSMHCMYSWGNDYYIKAMTEDDTIERYDIKMHPDFGDLIYLNKLSKMQKKYIEINSDIYEKMIHEINTLFMGQKVLGVHARGTDYKKGYSNCARYIKPDVHLQSVKKHISAFDKVFLATDNEETILFFKKELGNKLCYFKDVYRSKDNKEGVHYSFDTRKMHKYKLGYEVLRDMVTLANCNALVAGKSGVSTMAWVYKYSLGQEYDFIDILDNGRYK